RRLESPRADRSAQPLSGASVGEPSAAGYSRPPHPSRLHDSAEIAPADLRVVFRARGGAARRLSPLPDQRLARSFRAARHADPAPAARQGQSLCREEAPVMDNRVDQSGVKIGAVRRQAAFVFIFATILLDMLAMGIIIPVLPKLVVDFTGGDTQEAARVFGLF